MLGGVKEQARCVCEREHICVHLACDGRVHAGAEGSVLADDVTGDAAAPAAVACAAAECMCECVYARARVLVSASVCEPVC